MFITTKVWNTDQGYDGTLRAFQTSLDKLGMEYVDLYLIHWPVPEKLETWKVLEKILESGKARSIGVSNFTIRHLEELLRKADKVPAVNQVEFSPYLYQKELLAYCRSKGIQLEAYSPLTRGRKLGDEKLKKIASGYSRTAAQLLLRWQLQHGMVVIPKSGTKERISENADVFGFCISEKDMEILDSINEGLRVTWDPSEMP